MEVAALSITRIVAPNPFDVNNDGVVNMRDIGEFCAAFGSTSEDPNWNPDYDVTGPTPLVPDGRVDMRDIGEVCRHFGETDL